MKRYIYPAAILLFLVNISVAQEKDEIRIPLIGESAPAFIAQSTRGQINFPDRYFGKWKILLSHPADFTAVCSSEILELASMQEDFKKLNTALIVLSTDGLNSHVEWVKSLESIEYKGIKTAKINFPILADQNMEVSKKYGMIHPNSNSTKNIRAVFIINPEDKISALFYYPTIVGRNLEEIKRTLIALQTVTKKNVLTPANWEPGEDVMIPSPSTSIKADRMENNKDLYSAAWYMWFKKSD